MFYVNEKPLESAKVTLEDCGDGNVDIMLNGASGCKHVVARLCKDGSLDIKHSYGLFECDMSLKESTYREKSIYVSREDAELGAENVDF